MLKKSKIVNVLIVYEKKNEKKKMKKKSIFKNFFSFSPIENQKTLSINKTIDVLAKKIYYLTDIPTKPVCITSDFEIDLLIKKLESTENLKDVVLLPLYPQFSYEITGNLANLFYQRLPESLFRKCLWIKSFSQNMGFINSWQKKIQESLNTLMWKEEDTIFIFFPKNISQIKKEYLFHYECHLAKRKILKKFPYALGHLIKLGEVINYINTLTDNRKNILFIPVSNLFDEEIPFQEINELFISLQKRGFTSSLCLPLNLNSEWIHSICNILEEGNVTNGYMLLPPKNPIE